VISDLRIREIFHHPDYQDREINQPIFKFLRFHLLQNQKSKILNQQSSIRLLTSPSSPHDPPPTHAGA
jgi:hypothetical protein